MEALEKCAGGCNGDGCGYLTGCDWMNCDDRCVDHLAGDALALLKEQELPTELKQKMWNAFYAEEDEYEKNQVLLFE